MAASATPTPRLLHYMFLSLVPPGAPPRPANLSRAYDYWMRSCVRANPAYKIVLWTRDDCDRLIATRHPKYAQFYNETLGAMGVIRQADFCRVAVLATHGGVYLDFDFLCVRSFDALLSRDLIIADEPVEHKRRWGRRASSPFPCNALMGGAPGHPYWASLMALFAKRAENWRPGHKAILTGPHMAATAWRAAPPATGLLPTETFYPVPARVERARDYDAPRSYPNATVAAHQWGHFYSGGVAANARVVPVPDSVRVPGAVLPG